jgi:hypothetical protein
LPWWIVGLIWGILLQRLLFESKILFKCALPFGHQTYFYDFGIRLFASNEPPFGRPHTPPGQRTWSKEPFPAKTGACNDLPLGIWAWKMVQSCATKNSLRGGKPSGLRTKRG